MNKLNSMFLPLVLVLGTACGGDAKKDEEKAEKAPSNSKSHTCKIIVAEAVGDTKYKGNAATEDEAWSAACEQIPEDQRGECKNAEKFSKQTTEVTVNDEKQYNVVLKPKAVEFEAEKESSESTEAACKAALEEACKAAGSEGDCVASGKFEKRGEMASSTAVNLK